MWTIDPPAKVKEAAKKGAKMRTSETHPITLSWCAGGAQQQQQRCHNGGGCDQQQQLQRQQQEQQERQERQRNNDAEYDASHVVDGDDAYVGRSANSSSMGQLGLCYCPGKNVVRYGIQWKRNMRMDVERLKCHFNITTVVCLLSEYELRGLGIDEKEYDAAFNDAGVSIMKYPIIEMAPPESVEETHECLVAILQQLKGGLNVAMHCRGGVGRAGTLAACLLLLEGRENSPQGAIASVRRSRCSRALESRRQEQFVTLYHQHLQQQQQQQQEQEQEP